MHRVILRLMIAIVRLLEVMHWVMVPLVMPIARVL